MYAVQYITIVIVLALMVYVLGRYGRKEFEWGDFLFWEALLLGLLIVAIFPLEIANEIKHILGLGRGLDALFVISIGLAYILMFRVYLAVDKTEREITELTRKIAMELEEINKRLEKIEKNL
ncbi:hypothetical protein TON_1367 [Thermococcus onnurineus NA1]|uniref:UDP-N-acetylglucosamine--dolichyl-phosphate N-acetylglucosaminephosphotransferase n=1 Tax=Thermococcus onnurineus (strain NA1) TaxID=523850 RepID=B6YXP4_THEON|nr:MULTISPECIES: DUF2304 family protein [Thermococcus]ACJ16857.1 hypothetical protein TON_1367 [Thermococcus onnurineus NA1]NJE43351.1 DUF2304 family protein [Thermococcus sp. GR6]NJE46791.1 DUF2304 family protein [Thermococcus sp. GR7]NJE77781.1 DUF2304 family protein [Thermococcus sp. GR4]NJF23415.1 DUF2304 family protein [Thermococcus sp. GR5]